MSTAAEQYRQLVNKLVSINEELKIGDIDPRTGRKILSAMTDSDGNVVRSGTGEIWNVKYGPAELKPAAVAEPVAVQAEPVKDTPVEPVKDTPAPTPTPTPTPAVAEPDKKVEPCGPEVKEKIRAEKTFNAAYAMARKAGCPDFDWCQIVSVPGQTATPKPSGQKVDFTGQATPLGGNAENPMSFAPNSNFGAEEGYESDEYILEDELNRVREIAGTQVVLEAGADIPEIKAANKQAAIEIARKKGIKRFRFCGKYKVQAKKPGQTATPKPGNQKVDFTGQATPLGGTAENPMSFAPNSNFGA